MFMASCAQQPITKDPGVLIARFMERPSNCLYFEQIRLKQPIDPIAEAAYKEVFSLSDAQAVKINLQRVLLLHCGL